MGVWTAESARQEAKVQLGRVAQGDNPAEERQFDHKAITVKELCTLYLNDLNAGLILGKGGRPKKPTTVTTDTGRIERRIIPLLGTAHREEPTLPPDRTQRRAWEILAKSSTGSR